LAYFTSPRPQKSRGLLITLAAALVVLAPNSVWNIQHGFVTWQHTGDNVEGGGLALNPAKLAEFILGQFAVAGVLFAGVLVCLWQQRRTRGVWWWACLVPLVLITVQAGLVRANANWAASAYVAGVMLVALRWAYWPRLAVWALAVLHGAAALALPLLPLAGVYGPIKRFEGCAPFASSVATLARSQGVTAIATDSRRLAALLTYHLRGEMEVHKINRNTRVDDYFEMAHPVQAGQTYLAIQAEGRDAVCAAAHTCTPLPALRLKNECDKTTSYRLYRAGF
jgi:hypothetical protein